MTIGKVKITHEQADALENFVNAFDIATLIDDHAEHCLSNGGWTAPNYRVLNDLSQADLARALLIGYEVEPTYRIGDWVAGINTGRVRQITQVDNAAIWADWSSVDSGEKYLHVNYVRHATPEEIAEATKPKFEVGDWIIFKNAIGDLLIGMVEAVGKTSVDTDYVGSNGYKQNFEKKLIRHATPEEIKVEKERRVWAGIGRKPKKFLGNDILVNSDSKGSFTVGGFYSPSDGLIDSRTAERWYKEGKVAGIYPVESFVSFEECDER